MKKRILNLNFINLTIASSLAFIYTVYYLVLQQYSIGIPDAVSRLNIARRIIDNITPGFAQLGGVWMPIPQVFYVPLVQIDFLYRTGLAGALVNGIFFVIGSYFAFKIIEVATEDRRAAFVGSIAYSTASNLLFFQTTAMSEVATVTFMLGACYYLLLWAKENILSGLFKSALFIALVSLTRYEGFAILGLSYICVLVIAYYKKRKWSSIEGTFIMFATLASLGFALWTLYLAAIFGDPLYWLHVYTNTISIVSYETKDVLTTSTDTAGFNIYSFLDKAIAAFFTLTDAIIEMNGLFVTALGLIGFIIALIYFITKRKVWGLSYLILFGPLFFLIMILLGGNVPMVVPAYTFDSIFEKGFNLRSEYNIRYALQILPIFIVFIGFLAKSMKQYSVILIIVFVLQFLSPFKEINLLFAIQNRPPEIFTKYGPSIDWINANYNGGKMLASVLANDSIMFHINVPYKTYIFEGNNKYFTDSLEDPTKYATWVMFKNIPKDEKVQSFTDRVGFFLKDNPILLKNYDLVYEGELLVYKIKTKPQIEL